MKRLLLSLTVLSLISCNDKKKEIGYTKFESFTEFSKTIESIADDPDTTKIYAFWDSLMTSDQVPFIMGDSIAFMFMGDSSTKAVQWVGDINGWNPNLAGYNGNRLGNSNLWMLKKSFPVNARLDYKVVVNGTEWILDPANSRVQYSGWGPNSEFSMPKWEFPKETVLSEGAERGSVTDFQKISSSPDNLGYDVNYRVYTPSNYEQLTDLPVIYVTDGHEYSDDKLGSMVIVLDNLIHQGKIEPLIAVFIEPLDPANRQNNRRMSEYAANIKFADFVADELVPMIDKNYKTNSNPERRAILGTSMGGWNSAYFGLKKSDKFHLIGIHSPAFNEEIIRNYKDSPKLPLKIFMSTGVIHDTHERARTMKQVLDMKGYPLQYIEVNEGHSWGNWRALIEEPLVYFFGKSA
jgi:enterochelin esterase family protein